MGGGLLDGRTVIVTGGSRGIGAETAVQLAAHGANVVVNYNKSADAAALVVAEIRESGGVGMAVQADVESPESVQELVAATLDVYGTIDSVVVNAFPGFVGGDIADVEWETYRSEMESIMAGAIHIIKAALPTMRSRRQGSIITLGTTSMMEMNFQHTPYIAAKGALLELSRGLARDLGPENIRVNIVSPGLTWTDREHPQPEDRAPEMLARTPMGRLATSKDIAGAVVFLASDLSSFITGVHIPVCGGMVMNVI